MNQKLKDLLFPKNERKEKETLKHQVQILALSQLCQLHIIKTYLYNLQLDYIKLVSKMLKTQKCKESKKP